MCELTSVFVTAEELGAKGGSVWSSGFVGSLVSPLTHNPLSSFATRINSSPTLARGDRGQQRTWDGGMNGFSQLSFWVFFFVPPPPLNSRVRAGFKGFFFSLKEFKK